MLGNALRHHYHLTRQTDSGFEANNKRKTIPTLFLFFSLTFGRFASSPPPPRCVPQRFALQTESSSSSTFKTRLYESNTLHSECSYPLIALELCKKEVQNTLYGKQLRARRRRTTVLTRRQRRGRGTRGGNIIVHFSSQMFK